MVLLGIMIGGGFCKYCLNLFCSTWFNLSGFYHTGSYLEAASAQKALDSALAAAGAGDVAKPKAGGHQMFTKPTSFELVTTNFPFHAILVVAWSMIQ